MHLFFYILLQKACEPFTKISIHRLLRAVTDRLAQLRRI